MLENGPGRCLWRFKSDPSFMLPGALDTFAALLHTVLWFRSGPGIEQLGLLEAGVD